VTFEGDNCRAAEAPLPPTATARAADAGDGDGADGAVDDTGERDCAGDVPRRTRDDDGLLLLLAVGDDDDHGLSYEGGGKADGGSRPKLLPPPLLPSARLPGPLEAGRERISSASTDSERWASCHRSRLAFECRSVCRAKVAVGGDLRDTQSKGEGR